MAPGAFRFFLASLVVVSHYTSLGLGRAAVLLFFSLSGYWVCQMWVGKYAKTRTPYVTYIVSRVWRLGPVFLLCSGAALVIIGVLPRFLVPLTPFAPIGLDAIVSSVILLGYNTIKNPPLVPAWSLDLELQFYLIVPIIIATLHKRALLTVVVITGVALAGLVSWGDRTLLPYLPFFLVGMLAAHRPQFRPSSRAAAASAMAVVVVLVVLALIPTLRPMLFGGAHPGPMFAYNTPLNVFVALLAVPFAMNTVLRPSSQLDRLLSDASYSLYLFHWVPILIVGHYLPQIARSGMVERALWTLLVLALTYALTIGITVWIDRPLNELRTRFVKSRLRIQTKNKLAVACSTT